AAEQVKEQATHAYYANKTYSFAERFGAIITAGPYWRYLEISVDDIKDADVLLPEESRAYIPSSSPVASSDAGYDSSNAMDDSSDSFCSGRRAVVEQTPESLEAIYNLDGSFCELGSPASDQALILLHTNLLPQLIRDALKFGQVE
ncbi:hypothetical protein H0H92_015925, partial [Tricholoma furcatifolium]